MVISRRQVNTVISDTVSLFTTTELGERGDNNVILALFILLSHSFILKTYIEHLLSARFLTA